MNEEGAAGIFPSPEDSAFLRHWYGADVGRDALLAIYKRLGKPLSVEVDDDEGDVHCLGGAFATEHHSQIYDALCLAHDPKLSFNGAGDEKRTRLHAKILKALRGLHRSPGVPCTTTGVVCVDLEAARFYLESYFGISCRLIDAQSDDEIEGCPFWFCQDERAEAGSESDWVLNTLLAHTRALTAFQHSSSAPRKPPFLEEGRPLPAFAPTILAGGADEAEAVAEPPAPPFDTESLAELFSCCLCLGVMIDPASLPCGHSACIKCLQHSFKNNFRSCPVCRRGLARGEENVRVTATLRDVIQKLYPETASASESMWAPRRPRFGVFESKILAVSYPERPQIDAPAGSRDEAVEQLSAARLEALEQEAVRDARRTAKEAAEALRAEAVALDAATGRAERGVPNDSLAGFKDAHLQAVLRSGGVLAEHASVFDELHDCARTYLETLFHDVLTFAEMRRSRIIQVGDVIAARPRGVTMLGFGGDCSVRFLWTKMAYKVLKQVRPDYGLDPVSISVINDISTEVLRLMMEAALGRRARMPAFTGPRDPAPPRDPENPDEGPEEVDERAVGVRKVRAGTDMGNGRDSNGFADNHMVNIFTCSDDLGDAFEALSEPLVCVTSADLQAAARLLFPGSLAKHALSEGVKSVQKFEASRPAEAETWNQSSMGVRAGLQSSPEHVALVLGRMFPGVPVTAAAAVYLAGTVEYICAEVLELGGSAARNEQSILVSSRHLHMAIRKDTELNGLFRKCIIRDGGLCPSLRPALLSLPGIIKTPSAFERSLVSKARNSLGLAGATCYFVDPRTGLHRCARQSYGELDGASAPAPLLDALSLETAAQRRELARAALSDADMALMKAEGLGVWTEEEVFLADEAAAAGAALSGGWKQPSLPALHGQRLRDIRASQGVASSCRLLPLGPLERVCRQLLSKVGKTPGHTGGKIFAAEALDCIGAYLEAHLVQVSEDAGRLAAEHDGRRCAVLAMDVKFARMRDAP